MTVEDSLDALRTALSRDVAQRVLPQHQAVLRTMLGAAISLSAAVESERALIASLIALGYEAPGDILRRPTSLAGALKLGSLQQYDSEIST